MVTKFILPTWDDLKLSLIKYDKECKYIHNLGDQDNEQFKQNIKELLLYCSKLGPYMAFYKMQIKAHNSTPHHILKNEVDLLLPKFYEGQKSKRGTLVMYGIYNAETLEILVKRVHALHSRQTLYESLFASKTLVAYESYLQMHGSHGIQHYAVNSMLYLRKIEDKCIEIYNEIISQLHIYTKAVRILAKGYLPISLIMPLKL